MTYRNSIVKRPLTELQQAILDFIWANEGSTVDHVREGLLPKHRLKDSTVRTLLRRLEGRGFLSHRVDGSAYRYRATMRPHSVAARAVQHIIAKFCSGSTEQFLLGMVDENVLTVDELQKLASRVRRARK